MSETSLFPPQQEVINYGFLESNFNCLLNMSTGSGKTFLAEIAIERCIEKGFKAIYLTPLRALANEKFNTWKKRFPNVKLGLFTGDTAEKFSSNNSSYRSTQIYIMTPERLDMCIRNWRTHWFWLPDIDLLVVDEFHLLNDVNRGPRLEGTITRLQRINPFAKFLALSATMPNVDELSDWLNGVYYKSKWRQIPLRKNILRYGNAKDKIPLLLDEVNKCIQTGGQALVFVNSRSRAQQLSDILESSNIRAAHHHAGLKLDEREITELNYRNGYTQVLVCTSTLEMGLNLPARKVIIFDSYIYDGIGFSPLPVWSYMQRAGRAGRPGLDTEGEVTLLLPKWVGETDKYINEDCEPVISKILSPKGLAEQILVELYTGFSKTYDDLKNSFFPLTLGYLQSPEFSIGKIINQLVLSDMLAVKEEEKKNGSTYVSLKPTKIGRLAVKLMFSPSAVKLIKDYHLYLDKLYFFDLLLIATLTDDCTPVLPANYEDLDELMDIIQPLPSNLLNLTLNQFQKVSSECPSTLRILASIKMAAICYAIVTNKDKKELAEKFDIYENDIDMLKDNVVRLLDGMTAIFNALSDKNDNEDRASEIEDDNANICKQLSTMLYYEIDADGVSLTNIPGIGGKLAKNLIGSGYFNIQDICSANPKNLSKVPGIGPKLVANIIEYAKNHQDVKSDIVYSEEVITLDTKAEHTKIDICPYRLRRSLELKLRGQDGRHFYVTGGREDHIVTRSQNQYNCDCMDFEKRSSDCKHILTVKRVLMDRQVLNMIKKIKEDTNHSLRTALPTLWFSISKPE